jgi:hypothetical protein
MASGCQGLNTDPAISQDSHPESRTIATAAVPLPVIGATIVSKWLTGTSLAQDATRTPCPSCPLTMDDQSWVDYRKSMDAENLRTLAILYRVWAGLQMVIGCCAVGYIGFITLFVGAATQASREGPPPVVVSGFLGVAGIVVFTVVVAIACLNLLVANWLLARRNWTAIIVMSALNCLSIPLGLALGVFTMVVLNRPTVRPLFDN